MVCQEELTDVCRAVRSMKLHNAPVMCKKEPQMERKSGLQSLGIKILVGLGSSFVCLLAFQCLALISFLGAALVTRPEPHHPTCCSRTNGPGLARPPGPPPVPSSRGQPCHTSPLHNCISPHRRQLFSSAPSEPGV